MTAKCHFISLIILFISFFKKWLTLNFWYVSDIFSLVFNYSYFPRCLYDPIALAKQTCIGVRTSERFNIPVLTQTVSHSPMGGSESSAFLDSPVCVMWEEKRECLTASLDSLWMWLQKRHKRLITISLGFHCVTAVFKMSQPDGVRSLCPYNHREHQRALTFIRCCTQPVWNTGWTFR